MPAPPVNDLQLSVGTIEYDGDAQGYDQGADALSVAYGDFQMTNHYVRDGLTFAGSNTSATPFNGSQISVIRIGAPRLLWVCEWTASRLGAEPHCPDPTSQPADWTLLDVHLSPHHVSMGPSGSDPVYRISGVYVYVKGTASPSVFADAQYPKAPWVREGAFSRTVTADVLERDWMAFQTGGGGGSPGFAVQG